MIDNRLLSSAVPDTYSLGLVLPDHLLSASLPGWSRGHQERQELPRHRHWGQNPTHPPDPVREHTSMK